MTTTDGALSFATAIDTSGFKRGVAMLQQCVHDAAGSISNDLGNAISITDSLESSIKRLGAAVGIAFSANQAWDFVKQLRDVRSEIQSLEISFETLLGNKQKADELFGSIREFAVNTPMQLKDLASAAQMMLSFNISEDKIMPYLKALGDVSMGDTMKFNSLSLAFSQMSSAGKLMGQDLMQMINAGFNPLAQMAEKTGKSISELKDEMSAGKITAEMVQQAFIDATSEGGKYFGMLEKQSHGIAGAMSNLQGSIDDMLNEMGESSEGIITSMYSSATSIVKNWRDVAEAIGAAVGVYGAYKAAVMVDTAVGNTVMSAQFAAEAEQLTSLIALKEAEANADVQAAVASGKLSASKAQEIIAIRAEASAVVESLQAKAAQAKIDAERAVAAEAAAKRRYLGSVKDMEAASAQLLAAQRSGDAFAISAAQAEVDAAAQKRDADMKAYNAAMTETKTKAQASAVASTTAETAATQLNAAAEKGNAAATSFLTAVKVRLMGVVQKLYATMMAHPYAIALAAAVALGYGIYKLCTQQTNAERAQAKLNETFAKSEAAARSEMASIDALFNALRKAEQGTSQYKAIKDQIISQYGQYLKGLVDEKNNLLDVEAAYIRVANAAKEAARERAISDATKTAQDTFQQDTQAAYDKIYDKLKKKGGIGQALYDMIKMDLESSGKLSANTMNQLYEAYGARVKEKTKDGKLHIKNVYNKDVSEIKKAVSEIIGAQEILNNAISETQKRYGNVINDFLSYDVAGLKAEREALLMAIQTNQTKGYQIYLSGRLVQSIGNVAEAKLALKKIDEAIAANANNVHRTEMDNYREKEKAYRDAEAALNDIKANMDKYDEGAYAKAEENYKAAKKAFEDVGGVTKGNKGKSADQLGAEADVATESLTAVERKQARDRKRLQEDLELDLWQARIDSGKYGAQAYLQQRELDFKKEQTQLQRQMEDAIDAEIARQKELWDKQEALSEKEAKSNGKTYVKKAFDSDNLSSLEFKPGTTFSDDKIGDVDMANIYAISQQYAQLKQLLLDSQDKTRQKEAERQQQAMNEYLSQWGDYLQKRQALIDIANAKLSDPDANLTEGERLGIAAQLDKDLSDLDMEANKKTSAIARLFDDMSEKAVKDLRSIANDGKKALDMLVSGKYDKDLGKQLNISKATFNTIKASPEKLDKIRKAIKQLTEQADGLETPLNKISLGLKDLFNSADNPQKFGKALSMLKSGLDDVMAGVGVLSSAFSSLGDAFDSDLMGAIGTGLNTAMDAMNGAMQGAQAGAVFGPWGAAAGAAIGLIGSLGSSLAKLHDAKHEKKIQQLQDQVDALEKSYKKLGREIEKSYSKDASNLIEQQNRLLQQQKILIQQQIREEESKKKTDKDRIKQWRDEIDDINDTIEANKDKAVDAIFGEDVKSAIDRFADAYASMFDNGLNKAKASKSIVKDMIKNMIVEAMKSDISKPMEALRAKMAEFWSKGFITTYEESILNDMSEKLMSDLASKYGWADRYFKDTFSQGQGSSGGFQAMTEDTAEELNGRFTSMIEGIYNLDTTLQSVVPSVQRIETDNAQLVNYAQEMQNISLLQLSELEAISAHCKAIYEMSEELLTKIERNTSDL